MIELNNFNAIIKSLEHLNIDKEHLQKLDTGLSRYLINNIGIKYLEERQELFPVTEILGIKCVCVEGNLYKVVDAGENSFTKCGDIIINPPMLSLVNTKRTALTLDIKLTVLHLGIEKPELTEENISLVLNESISSAAAFEEKSLPNDVQYIPIPSFREYLEQIMEINYDKTLVIDLRNNSGGPIEEMITAFENIFKDSRVIGEKISQFNIDFKMLVKKKSKTLPNITLIVNKNTASAAEIFAFLCRNYFYASIIGTETYGKNVICRVKKLQSFTFQYPQYTYTVSGKKLLENGLKPDILIEDIDKMSLNMVLKRCFSQGCFDMREVSVI